LNRTQNVDFQAYKKCHFSLLDRAFDKVFSMCYIDVVVPLYYNGKEGELMNNDTNKETDNAILRMRELLKSPAMVDMERGKNYEVHIPKSKELNDELRLSPMADSVFKIIFQNEEYKRFTCKLISAIVGIEYDYLLENMTFYKNTYNKSTIEDVQRSGDLIIKLSDIFLIVEMNNYESLGRNFKNSVLLAGIRIPDKNGVRFFPVIDISINNYRYKDMDYSIDVTSDISILPERQWFTTLRMFHINVFLPIIEEKSYNELNETEEVILALFSPHKKKIEPLLRKDELLMELNDTLDSLERNTDFLYDYDFELEKETALKEDGKKEARIEVIKKMLEKGMELSDIVECVNLDIEEVKKIIQSLSKN